MDALLTALHYEGAFAINREHYTSSVPYHRGGERSRRRWLERYLVESASLSVKKSIRRIRAEGRLARHANRLV